MFFVVLNLMLLFGRRVWGVPTVLIFWTLVNKHTFSYVAIEHSMYNLMLPLGREIAIEHVHDECKRRCLAEGHFCILQGYDRTLTIDRAKAI